MGRSVQGRGGSALLRNSTWGEDRHVVGKGDWGVVTGFKGALATLCREILVLYVEEKVGRCSLNPRTKKTRHGTLETHRDLYSHEPPWKTQSTQSKDSTPLFFSSFVLADRSQQLGIPTNQQHETD